MLLLAKKGLMRVGQSLEGVRAALQAVLDALVVAELADWLGFGVIFALEAFWIWAEAWLGSQVASLEETKSVWVSLCHCQDHGERASCSFGAVFDLPKSHQERQQLLLKPTQWRVQCSTRMLISAIWNEFQPALMLWLFRAACVA